MGCRLGKQSDGNGSAQPGQKYAVDESSTPLVPFASSSAEDVKISVVEPRGHSPADFYGSWTPVVDRLCVSPTSSSPHHELFVGVTSVGPRSVEADPSVSFSKATRVTDVVVTNSGQPWSPAQGTLQGSLLTLRAPESVQALEIRLADNLLNLRGGVVLKRVMEDFSGTWATASVWLGEKSSNSMLGTSNVAQGPNGSVVVENADQPWSPATGFARGLIMTLEAPPEMRGVTGTVSGRQLTLSSGITLYRTMPNFRGLWQVPPARIGHAACAQFLGDTVVTQTEDVVTLTNDRHPWSPASGTVAGPAVEMYAPAQMKGLKATLKSGQLHLSNDCVLWRRHESDQGSSFTFTSSLPKSEVIHIPMEDHKVVRNEEDCRLMINPREYRLKPLNLGTEKVVPRGASQKADPLKAANIFDINLFEGDGAKQNVERYYSLCKDYVGLQVTTSCFKVWREKKKTNGYAKVIPAVKSSGNRDDVRIFFFDDNLEWEGTEKSSGICNLRDVATGDFVEFAEGRNGFVKDTAASHTVIHTSSEYHNVLVKANILDAMEDPDYFSSIIARYTKPHERIIVYMDVNSTILCNDSVQGKALSGTLLSTIFEFVELKPGGPFDLAFDGHPTRTVSKTRTLKQLVKEVTGDDHKAYGDFWTEDTCWRFFEELASNGEIKWLAEGDNLSLEAMKKMFNHYLVALERVQTKDGLALSWFRVFDRLRERDTMVLNSFGVDTRKVILATVPDECRVLQVTVNHGMWEERDTKKYASQFAATGALEVVR